MLPPTELNSTRTNIDHYAIKEPPNPLLLHRGEDSEPYRTIQHLSVGKEMQRYTDDKAERHQKNRWEQCIIQGHNAHRTHS